MCNKCGPKCKLSIPVNVLNKLPVGGRFVRFEKIKIFETEGKDNWIVVIVWEWFESKPIPTTKQALFNKDTGDYLGEI